ncbi:MAG: valine--tRNA ligase, partial [Lachnospiraceae bacterium]|nr:valine--tRNA ligase [Lachnospiraceae bacterium]
ATEIKILQNLAQKGIHKEDLGREGFLKEAWAWKETYHNRIISQLKKLGSSCDWDRTRFTMDEGLSNAVQTVFMQLYKKGMIYRGNRIVNWCPVCRTSISDAETLHEEMPGHFWHLRYPYADGSGYIEVATTRPETMLGDTAVAVHPGDERYADKVGKMVILPLVNKEIPVIADAYVDKDFGTGAVKITPAHDPNDFEVGQRHNLEQICVMTDDGRMNELAGKYAGMDRYEARKAMVADLKEQGYLVRIEDMTHAVGTHDRCHSTVEPMIKPQWFVAMDALRKPAIDAVRDGRIRFVPQRYEKMYFNWMENLHDWCISRQLWWGHRIPAYFCDECGNIEVSLTQPTCKCSKCGAQSWTQDEDTLDTWFSSALWPFSTLGWPDETPEMKYFYPTSVLVTGYDIITFWVSRMIFSALEYTGEIPFKDIVIHGLVRDDQGRKMSKSLGNGIDPLEIIDQYGADALRLTLVTGNAAGNDMRFYMSKVEYNRNFANKVWNASRFILMNLDEEFPESMDPGELLAADRWILSKCNSLAKEVTENLDKYEMGVAADKLVSFLWEELCDWYIEMVKARLYDKSEEGRKSRTAALWTLKTVLRDGLKMLHPFMPFITEEIYSYICPEDETIMYAPYPAYRDEMNFPAEEDEVERMKEAIRNIRAIRLQMNVPPRQKAEVIVVSTDPKVRETFEIGASFLTMLASASSIKVQADDAGIPDSAVNLPVRDGHIRIPMEQLVDLAAEKARLEKEKKRLEGELKRLEGKLSNQGFLAKAPAAVIEEEKAKQNKYRSLMDEVEKSLAKLG